MPEGVKHDAGKQRYDLLAPEGLAGLVSVITFGATKYTDRNWEKGMAWGRLFGATMRHLWAWWKGQETDPESGLSHLHHAACCIHFLQTYDARSIGTDDRPKKNPQPKPGAIINCDTIGHTTGGLSQHPYMKRTDLDADATGFPR
jgi:hypothetical protein